MTIGEHPGPGRLHQRDWGGWVGTLQGSGVQRGEKALRLLHKMGTVLSQCDSTRRSEQQGSLHLNAFDECDPR